MGEPPSLRAGAHFFHVDEICQQAPDSDDAAGAWRWLQIEKVDLSTELAADLIAQAAGIDRRHVAYAGRKDRHGCTRQWLSLPADAKVDQASLPGLVAPFGPVARLVILAEHRSRRKLTIGRLAGNRFRLGITSSAHLQQPLADLTRSGIPNRFDAQRFGRAEGNLVIARALAKGDLIAAIRRYLELPGDWLWGDPLPDDPSHHPRGSKGVHQAYGAGAEPAAVWRRSPKRLRTFIRNAAQSRVFNQVLDEREAASSSDQVQVGDLVQIEADLQLADSADLTTLQEAVDAGEALITGPLPGQGGAQPTATAAAIEAAAADSCGFPLTCFTGRGVFSGRSSRRPLRIRFLEMPEISIDAQAQSWLQFALPPGAYATQVLRSLGITVPSDRSGSSAAPSAPPPPPRNDP